MGAGAGAGARARARAGVELGRAAIRHAMLRRTRASGEPRRLGEEEREGKGGLQAKATVSVRGRVHGVYAQNGITSCGVGLMSGSVSGGRAADRRTVVGSLV